MTAETRETLEYVPPQIKVVEHVRFKYACRGCQQNIERAAMPLPPLAKAKAGPSLLAHIIVSKYLEHAPLYRQEKHLERHHISIPRGHHSRWLMAAGDLIEVLPRLLREEIIASGRIWTDDTIAPQLPDISGRKKVIKGRLWVYVGGGITGPPLVVYEYSRSRSASWPKQFLEGFEGYLQADAAPCYDGLYKDGTIKECGCMMHCRRYFYEAWLVSQAPGRADEALRYIRALYHIEDEAKTFDDEARYRYRQVKAKPILDKFKQWLDQQINAVAPKTRLGEAVSYAYKNWTALSRYLDAGHLTIDNGMAEREMRLPALGRRNWLFVGNERAGRVAATFYSLIETCIHHGVNPYEYFTDMLTRFRSTPEDRLVELLPHRWQPSA